MPEFLYDEDGVRFRVNYTLPPWQPPMMSPVMELVDHMERHGLDTPNWINWQTDHARNPWQRVIIYPSGHRTLRIMNWETMTRTEVTIPWNQPNPPGVPVLEAAEPLGIIRNDDPGGGSRYVRTYPNWVGPYHLRFIRRNEALAEARRRLPIEQTMRAINYSRPGPIGRIAMRLPSPTTIEMLVVVGPTAYDLVVNVVDVFRPVDQRDPDSDEIRLMLECWRLSDSTRIFSEPVPDRVRDELVPLLDVPANRNAPQCLGAPPLMVGTTYASAVYDENQGTVRQGNELWEHWWRYDPECANPIEARWVTLSPVLVYLTWTFTNGTSPEIEVTEGPCPGTRLWLETANGCRAFSWRGRQINVCIRDVGGSQLVYTLRSSFEPCAPEDSPGALCTNALVLPIGGAAQTFFHGAGESHWFKFTAEGGPYHLSFFAEGWPAVGIADVFNGDCNGLNQELAEIPIGEGDDGLGTCGDGVLDAVGDRFIRITSANSFTYQIAVRTGECP